MLLPITLFLQGLKEAMDTIDREFRYAVLYIQGLCFLQLCFIFYAYLQNNGITRTMMENVIFVVFVGNVIFHVAFFTVPAYITYEKVSFVCNMFICRINELRKFNFIVCMLGECMANIFNSFICQISNHSQLSFERILSNCRVKIL